MAGCLGRGRGERGEVGGGEEGSCGGGSGLRPRTTSRRRLGLAELRAENGRDPTAPRVFRSRGTTAGRADRARWFNSGSQSPVRTKTHR